jgi:Tol biopolymer transport system component
MTSMTTSGRDSIGTWLLATSVKKGSKGGSNAGAVHTADSGPLRERTRPSADTDRSQIRAHSPRARVSVAIEPKQAGPQAQGRRTRPREPNQGDYRQGASPMKNHKLAGSICALLLTALGASSAAAQTSTSQILFTRNVYRAFDGAHGTALYRVKTSGANAAQLASVIYGVDDLSGSWSPTGAAVVYDAEQQGENQNEYISSQLYVVDRQGGSPRQITTGTTGHVQPMWAPNSGIVAYVQNGCLATVRANGTDQHVVFCAPRDQGMGSRPGIRLLRWTGDGKSVFVVAATNEGGLDPKTWYSDVYRVNVTTGLATKLAQQAFTSGGFQLAIAPGGTHGVYDGSPMQSIDFATNKLTPLPTAGNNMVYSPDGTKIAFFRIDSTSPYENNIYVMDADGGHVSKLTQQAPYKAYLSIAGWSRDSSRLLVNFVGNSRWMRLIDVRTKSVVNVAKGTALQGAWFHP